MPFGLFFEIIKKKLGLSADLPDFVYIGVGNIGKDYENTRHNIGFDVLEEFKKELYDIKTFTICKARIAEGIIKANGDKKKIWCVWPKTYVNKTGDSVYCLKRKFSFSNKKFVVIVDDFNIESGNIRVRKRGSAGGHNGLKSVISVLGEEFVRIRIGIGPLPKDVSIIDFVLGKFSEDEEKTKVNILKKASECLKDLPFVDIDTLMNKYNKPASV